MLDKTGTVTAGRMALVDVLMAPGQDQAEFLRLAGAVEDASEHPVGRAIAAGAAPDQHRRRERQHRRRERHSAAALPPVTAFASHQGSGVTGRVSGHDVAIGRADWLAAARAGAIPRDLAGPSAAAQAHGQTVTFVAWDGLVRGACVVADTVKPTSAAAIARLRAMGLRVRLLTGDNERAAGAVAAALGIAPGDVIAGVLPSGKADVIKALQDMGRVVAMAGDGVNDAAALAQADLGLAMGTGTDAAIEASDLTLVRGDLLAVPDAIELSRKTLEHHQGQPGLGLRLQRRGHTARRARPAEPDDRRRRDGPQLGARRHQQPPAPPRSQGRCLAARDGHRRSR